jgi:hypothetical protein
MSRILTGRDRESNPEKWIEITKEEYIQNKSDIDNYMYCFEMDSGIAGFYKKSTEVNA